MKFALAQTGAISPLAVEHLHLFGGPTPGILLQGAKPRLRLLFLASEPGIRVRPAYDDCRGAVLEHISAQGLAGICTAVPGDLPVLADTVQPRRIIAHLVGIAANDNRTVP